MGTYQEMSKHKIIQGVNSSNKIRYLIWGYRNFFDIVPLHFAHLKLYTLLMCHWLRCGTSMLES